MAAGGAPAVWWVIGSGMDTIETPLLVVGGGNMGRAIVEGAVGGGHGGGAGEVGVLRGDRVVVVDPNAGQHGVFRALGAACVETVEAGVRGLVELESRWGTGAVLLAVKPQMLAAVAPALAAANRVGERTVMSILAGVPTARLSAEVGGRVVRLMPNTPAKVGKGITARCAGPGASGHDLELAGALFGAVGSVVDLPEDLLDAFTAVAGSGPAYVFLLAEGMVAGAEAVGFSREQALAIVRATVAGAAGLMEAEAGVAPEALRARVTSKGGTTAAALGVLEKRGVAGAVRVAIVAARDRGRELGRG